MALRTTFTTHTTNRTHGNTHDSLDTTVVAQPTTKSPARHSNSDDLRDLPLWMLEYQNDRL